jgi:hypothetical protein
MLRDAGNWTSGHVEDVWTSGRMILFGTTIGALAVYGMASNNFAVGFAAFIGSLIAGAVAALVWLFDTGYLTTLLFGSKKKATKIQVRPSNDRTARHWNPTVVISKKIKVLNMNKKDPHAKSQWRIGYVTDAQTRNGKPFLCVKFKSTIVTSGDDDSWEKIWINTSKEKWAWDTSPTNDTKTVAKKRKMLQNMT